MKKEEIRAMFILETVFSDVPPEIVAVFKLFQR